MGKSGSSHLVRSKERIAVLSIWVHLTGPMDLGDISWHHGWTLHTADAQPRSSPPRLALSISYFREGARVLPKQAAKHMQLEDQESFAGWRKEVKDGALASHRLLPLLSFDLTAVN